MAEEQLTNGVLSQKGYVFYENNQGVPIKAWTNGVPLDPKALQQARDSASLPFMHKHLALMPDTHWGMGATVGSVMPTSKAIVPAAVGVDIGCGMMAVHTSLTASDLPDNLRQLRSEIEKNVPHGRTSNGGQNDKGAWGDRIPRDVQKRWTDTWKVKSSLGAELNDLVEFTPRIARPAQRAIHHLGTLGSGNHFIEVCLDEKEHVWIMLHSGSRGIGNAIGRHYIDIAKKEMQRFFVHLPDKDLAYLPEGTLHFNNYMKALSWAQKFALINREVMMDRVMEVVEKVIKPFHPLEEAVNCHHNYVAKENHYGANVWVTRKGGG